MSESAPRLEAGQKNTPGGKPGAKEKTMSEAIVAQQIGGDFRLDTRALAERMGNGHASVMKLIAKNQASFEEFGGVGFEIQTLETRGGRQEIKYAQLNENQCYLLLTLVRNSETTVPMKTAVVAAFAKARELAGRAAPTSPLALSRLMLDALEQQDARVTVLEHRMDTSPITSEKVGTIHRLGQQLGQCMGNYGQAWRLFNSHFRIASYRDLPNNRFGEAVRFLRVQISAYTGTPLLEVEA